VPKDFNAEYCSNPSNSCSSGNEVMMVSQVRFRSQLPLSTYLEPELQVLVHERLVVLLLNLACQRQ
jgi:hypothetical protein